MSISISGANETSTIVSQVLPLYTYSKAEINNLLGQTGQSPPLNVISTSNPTTGAVDMNNYQIINLASPIADYQAMNLITTRQNTPYKDSIAVEDPTTHLFYTRMLAGDNIIQLKTTVDPLIPLIPGTQFKTLIENQAVTYKWVKEQIAKPFESDIDFKQHKGINCADPTASQDVANKQYCDSNSKNNDGTGAVVGSLLGGILGAAGGIVSSALLSSSGQGLSLLGQITGSLSAGTAALSTGLKVGSNADFSDYLPQTGESQQLIDNLKSDIANSNQPGGGLLNGALSVSGLFRANANSILGLFDV